MNKDWTREDNIGQFDESAAKRESERLIESIPVRIATHYAIGFMPKKYVGVAAKMIFSPDELQKMRVLEHTSIRRIDK
jgi:hypothetical protein